MNPEDMDYTATCGACYGDGRIAEDDCRGCDGDGTVQRLRRVGGKRYIQLGEDTRYGSVSRSVVDAVRFTHRFGDRSNTEIITDAYSDDRFEQGNRHLAWRFEQILAERVMHQVQDAPTLLTDPGETENLIHRYNTADGVSNEGLTEKVGWYEDLSTIAGMAVEPRNAPPLDLDPLRTHARSPPRIELDDHRMRTVRGVLGEEGERVEEWYAELVELLDVEDEAERFW